MKSNLKKHRQENSIKNPGAAVIIYNYKHRLGGTDELTADQAHEVDQLVLNTVSLKKVTTSKSKSQPAGSFEITLAPTKNWVNTITPGSWCIILMSQEVIVAKDTKYHNPTADINKVKMLGRIESVRAVTSIDQSTGAIMTEYIVQGEDWGGIFNTHLYVDPLIRGKAEDKNPIGTANRLIYNDKLIGYGKKDQILPSSTDNIKALISFMGQSSEAQSKLQQKSYEIGRMGKSESNFQVPKEIAKYFDFQNDLSNISGVFADIIDVRAGKLRFKDSDATENSNGAYKLVDDGASPIMLDTVLGSNTYWQLIMNNSNHWINDTYCEMRWNDFSILGGAKPELTVYNRIKPFAIHSTSEIEDQAFFDGDEPQGIEELTSRFKDIRTYKIDRADLLMANVGTNWRDRYNFVEINVVSGTLGGMANNQTFDAERKAKNQIWDAAGIGRDGLKPRFINTIFIPKVEGSDKEDPFRIIDYKTMSKEWFFNTHRMMNGSMSLIGQSEYVAVGDNLMIDADAMFPGKNINEDHITNKGETFFLAHIESVSHTCQVNENGTRSFMTEIQFVRGIITDENGEMIEEDVLLDENVNKVTPTQELNSNRVFGTSSGSRGKSDPDDQKLRGN